MLQCMIRTEDAECFLVDFVQTSALNIMQLYGVILTTFLTDTK